MIDVSTREAEHNCCSYLQGRANMSIHFTISKKVHRLAVVRSKIRYRIQEALGMIVTRGANGGETEQGMEIMEQDVGAERWILRGSFFFYIFWSSKMTPSRLDIRRIS